MQHEIPGLLVEGKATIMAPGIWFCKGLGRLYNLLLQVQLKALLQFFIYAAPAVRDDHDRHHGWHLVTTLLGAQALTPGSRRITDFFGRKYTLDFHLFGSQFSFSWSSFSTEATPLCLQSEKHLVNTVQDLTIAL